MNGMTQWLTSLMLNEELMEKARRDLQATLVGFDLSQEEKDFIISPESQRKPKGLTPLNAVIITAIRPQLLVRTPFPVRPGPPSITQIARVSEAHRALYSQGLRDERHTETLSVYADATLPTEQKVSAAKTLVDSIFAEAQGEIPNQPIPQRLLRQADITIVGLGMRSIDQLTREAERALLQANQVFLIESSFGLKEYLLSKGAKVNDLLHLYAEGKNRLETYKEMSNMVIEGAIRNGPVAFGLYGHPTVFAFPPFVVKEVAESLGLTVDVIPGISSMDCIFAELMIDPANCGLQMFEATDLLLTRKQLQTDVQTLIWQVGVLETGLYSTKPSSPKRYEKFIEYLSQYFPLHHPCTAIYCTDHPALPSSIYRFPLGKMGEFSEQLHGGFTIFLPPVTPPQIVDTALQLAINSAAHLDSVTKI
ncbi:SAM-dependent methyltransferase [Sulfuriferula sp.]|uniref:SAM-dependent methyltransferase n=1 Tax=Sulfuriferula sp. TaxID=2025307 RepID=UPI002731C4AD|nr:SAM-dependent methyltransferase [Sulfuriferula sp.]MDP2025623.1 SAM-dependent methyltransferase [Sulfuriferula sp.]